MRLLTFGLGYCARRFVQRFGCEFSGVSGTVQARSGRPRLAGVDELLFGDEDRSAELTKRVDETDILLSSIPPAGTRDPVLAAFGDVLSKNTRLRAIYLSTVGVYGDHGGAWVDETSATLAKLERTKARLTIETAWADTMPGRVMILRLAGIYGPDRNALTALSTGGVRRLIKPGQVFNRVHVDDVAGAIMAAIRARSVGIFNICDDEPAPPQDVITYAAKLMGVQPPPEEAFETAQMSEMMRSFYAGNARVSNAKLKRELGVTLRHANYRQGLAALWHEERPGLISAE